MQNEEVSIKVSFDEQVYNAIQKATIDNGTMHVKSYIKVLVLKRLRKELGSSLHGRPPKLEKDLMIRSIDIGFTESIYQGLEKASKSEGLPITEWIRRCVFKGFS